MATDYFVMETCVRNWLRYIHESDVRIAYLETRIPEIRSRLIGLGYDPSAQGGSGSQDGKIPDGLATLEELVAEWNHEVSERQREIELAKELCQSANVEQHIVWLRFVERKKWEEIASLIGYSKRQTQRKAEQGVESLFPYVPNSIWKISFPNAAAL